MKTEFWHAGLTVRDIARSVAFYRDVAGMEEGEHIHSASSQFATLTKNPGAELKTVFMTQGGFTLQLLEYVAGGGNPILPAHNSAGSPHLSFFVADIEEQHRAVVARGDTTITSTIVANARGTIRSFYVTDPDNTPVEFVERLGRP